MPTVNKDFATAADKEAMKALNTYFAAGSEQAISGYLYQGGAGNGSEKHACVALHLRGNGHSRTEQTPEVLLKDWYPKAQTLSVA